MLSKTQVYNTIAKKFIPFHLSIKYHENKKKTIFMYLFISVAYILYVFEVIENANVSNAINLPSSKFETNILISLELKIYLV